MRKINYTCINKLSAVSSSPTLCRYTEASIVVLLSNKENINKRIEIKHYERLEWWCRSNNNSKVLDRQHMQF